MSDYLTVVEIVDELRSLEKSRATGKFFVVSEANHAASIDFDQGRIVFVRFRIHKGERAISEMARINLGSCRFEQYAAAPEMMVELPPNDEIFNRLLSAQGVEAKTGAEPARAVETGKQATPAMAASGSAPSSGVQKRVELALIEELGPMGRVLVGPVLACSTVSELAAVIKKHVDNPAVAKAALSGVVEAFKPRS